MEEELDWKRLLAGRLGRGLLKWGQWQRGIVSRLKKAYRRYTVPNT